MQTSIIRPGLLVSLKTTIRGGVAYQTQTIEADHMQEGARVAKWETRREIANAAEHERAVKARSAARTAIVRTCCLSSFGLLCPINKEAELIAGIAEARRIADEFNAGAEHSTIDVYVIAGRIAASDGEAAAAIGSEVRELIEAMERGVRAADPEAIRDAANKARAMSGMLSADAQGAVSKAIAEVRSIARDIVRRTEKAGETAATIVNGLKLEALQAARFAVLDVADDNADAQAEDSAPIVAPALDLIPLACATDARDDDGANDDDESRDDGAPADGPAAADAMPAAIVAAAPAYAFPSFEL